MPVRQEQTCGPGLQRGQAASSGGNAWRRRPEPKLGSVVGNHAFLTSFCHGCYKSVVGLVAPLPREHGFHRASTLAIGVVLVHHTHARPEPSVSSNGPELLLDATRPDPVMNSTACTDK